MIHKSLHPTRITRPSIVTPYTMTGTYFKGQRLHHPQFGLGTVTLVRMKMVVILFDSDRTRNQPRIDKGPGRRFVSAKLSWKARNRANGEFDLDEFYDPDLDPTFEDEILYDDEEAA